MVARYAFIGAAVTGLALLCLPATAAQCTVKTFKATKKYNPLNGNYMGDNVTWDYKMVWSTSGLVGVAKCAVWYEGSQTYGADVFAPRFYNTSPASDANTAPHVSSPAYRLDIYVADPVGDDGEPVIYDPKSPIVKPV